MSKELLQKVIDKGVEGYLNEFFLDVSKYYTEMEDDLSEYDGNGFSDFQAIGEINFSPGEKLVVITANIVGDLTERSSKKVQYEKAKKILKGYMKYDAGIFVFSDPDGSFRFSLVYGQAEGIRKSWSNFRRFTYFVSRDQTNKTFYDRIGRCDFSSLDIIKDAFSVEKVTKEFYRQIADWYFWAVQKVTFPANAKQETNGRNIAVIRMITRLIFIWFMKERKLVSPELFKQEKLFALLKNLKPGDTTYYKAILQNLFFATLNAQIEERKFRFSQFYHGKNKDYMEHSIYRYEDYFQNQEDMLMIFKDIPFLNGGLFDCLDWSAKESGTDTEVRFDGFSDKEVGLNVPNYLFFSGETEADLNKEYGTKNRKYHVQGLLNILSAYNFTIDENDPNDQEVALDPELLGKVFENLLASFNPETATTARKATGSYYTPREIVDYMVIQSLKQYYKTHLGDVADIDNKLEELLSPITEEPVNPFGEADSKRVVRLTEELRIVDPAVGSGAFPMGILNKLVSVLARVDRDNRLWQEAQLKAVEAVTDPILKQKLIKQVNEQFSEKNSNYGRKLYLIQKCIYGVDIQQIAIEITKLRFFIALLVDERIDKSKPNWGIEPLPNLDFKLMQGNSLISEFMGINLDAEDSNSYGKLMKDETEELVTQYQNKKSQYQYEPDRARKEALKSEIEKLIVRIFESKLQSQKAEYFNKLKNIERKYASVPNIQQGNESIKKDTETLNRNYRFDLALAEKQLKEFTSGQKVKPFFAWRLYFAEVFQKNSGFDVVIANPPYIRQEEIGYKPALQRESEIFNSVSDLYTYFYERGLKLLKTFGILTFITSNKFLRARYGITLRRYLKTNTSINSVINFGDQRVFDAINNTLIFIAAKQKTVNNTFNYSESIDEPNRITFPQSGLQDSEWTINNPEVICLKNKIESLGTPLKDWNIKIDYGIKTGYNEAFIINEATKNELIKKDLKSGELIKPIIRGRDIKRYHFVNSGQYLIITHNGYRSVNNETIKSIDINKYPSIKNHLDKYIRQLKERQDKGLTIYNLRDCAFMDDFTKEKIIWLELTNENKFAYSNKEDYLLAGAFLMVGESLKYLLAFLNSKLCLFYFSLICNSSGMATIQWKKFALEKVPIMKLSDEGQKLFVEIVNKILAIINTNDYLDNPTKNAEVKEYEHQIDQMIYELYGLTPGEIAVVEGSIQGKGGNQG